MKKYRVYIRNKTLKDKRWSPLLDYHDKVKRDANLLAFQKHEDGYFTKDCEFKAVNSKIGNL